MAHPVLDGRPASHPESVAGTAEVLPGCPTREYRPRSGAPGSLVGTSTLLASGGRHARARAAVPALRTENLSKRYGRVLALDELDLTVAPGRGVRLPRPERRREVHHDPAAARPGPAHRRPGVDLRHRRRRRGRRAPAARLRAGRRGAVAAADRRRDPGAARPASGPGIDLAYRDELVERFALDLSKPAGAYSTGNRQKVALVAAFATRAPLLVLDEPTSGLDPLMERSSAGPSREARDRGQTVFLSSHQLAEVEAVCDRVGDPARRPAGRGGRPSPSCGGCTAPRSP